jgi:hypothetical protein
MHARYAEQLGAHILSRTQPIKFAFLQKYAIIADVMTEAKTTSATPEIPGADNLQVDPGTDWSQLAYSRERTEKERLAGIALNVARAIVEVAPQSQNDGSVNYYFAGSLAAEILPTISSYQRAQADEDGKLVLDETIKLTPEIRQLFLEFVRVLGNDIDISVVNNTPYDSAKRIGNQVPSFNLILERVPEARELFSGIRMGDIYDKLGWPDNEYKVRHNIAVATIENGEQILVTDPVYMFAYKLFELAIITRPESIGRPGLNVERDVALLYEATKVIYDEPTTLAAVGDVCRERSTELRMPEKELESIMLRYYNRS